MFDYLLVSTIFINGQRYSSGVGKIPLITMETRKVRLATDRKRLYKEYSGTFPGPSVFQVDQAFLVAVRSITYLIDIQHLIRSDEVT